MLVFIYAELQPDSAYTYQKPILTKIKSSFPKVNSLDVDAYSEEFLVSQACQLIEQADRCGIYFNSPDPEISLGSTIRLVEVLIRRQQKNLVILNGEHQRLERLFSNRAQLTFFKNPGEQLLFQYLKDLYS
ncbi:hypothetical protein AHMF7605_21055 [Adhaeribacter arboris]|uniref:Uncharacterized protein n=1 Tax=Adhaeribacter arboris TaxID=2072846 RepID=A0A2T2YJX0_9BACT|nr:hypothetical protein [Adhaeribacter arboris]PSR55807.1 hypothetical protein AHMF7605_21055 [Adhaeribacter arboris]